MTNYILLFYTAELLTLGILSPAGAQVADADSMLLYIVLGLSSVAVHLFYNRGKNWFRIDTLFIISFLVVYYQWPIMYVFDGYEPIYGFQARSIMQYAHYSIWISTLSLIGWCLGHSIQIRGRNQAYEEKLINLKMINYIFLVLMFAFAAVAGEDFFGRSIYTDGQEGLYQTISGLAAYISDLVSILVFFIIAYFSYNRKNLNYNEITRVEKFSLILTLIYSILFLLGGERGQVVQIGIVFGLIYALQRQSVSLLQFILILVTGFAFFTFIGVLRSLQDGQAVEFGLNYGLWEISTNLAQSVVTLTEAIDLIKLKGDYFYGQLWLSQILGLIPFAQSVFLDVSGVTIDQISSAVYVTKYTFGDYASSGLGISFVADAYLNFGVFGVVVLSIIYGVFCKIMSNWLIGGNGFYRYYVAIIFASYIIYVSRSSVLIDLKPIVWGYLFAILIFKIKNLRMR